MAKLKNITQIDVEALNEWLNNQPKNRAEIAEKLGRSRSYFYDVCRRGNIQTPVYKLMLNAFDLPEGSFIPKPKVTTPPPAAQKLRDGAIPGYAMGLQVFPDRVRVSVSYEGNEVAWAWAKVKDQQEVSLYQAISYASHMVYKIIEQRNLGGN